MDRYPGGQFPYSAFSWPALAAASAGELASSWGALFLGFSRDADGGQTPQEPEGATPGKIALELQAVRLRDFTVAQGGVPTLLCTPLALHGAAIAARQSRLSAMAEATPLIMFQSLVNLGDGRVIGRNIAKFWGNDTDANAIRESLQAVQPIGSSEFTQLDATFKNWNSWTIDLPGTYYLEVIEKLYRRNELASGSLIALGQKIDLSRLRLPMYLLAGSADVVVAPEQLLAVERLAGTPPEYIRHEVAPCNHLGLFMGKRTLEEYWPRIVRWMKEAD